MLVPSVPTIEVDEIFWDSLSFVIFSDINFQNLVKTWHHKAY